MALFTHDLEMLEKYQIATDKTTAFNGTSELEAICLLGIIEQSGSTHFCGVRVGLYWNKSNVASRRVHGESKFNVHIDQRKKSKKKIRVSFHSV